MPKNLEMQNGESLGVDDDLLCWCMNSPPLHTEANVFQVISAKETSISGSKISQRLNNSLIWALIF